jgi:NitT/TauT family transport system substrate-binding protein
MEFSAGKSSFSIRALAVTLLLLAGCDRGAETVNDGSKPSPPAVVRIGYFANLTHAQAVLGVSSGEFAQAIAPVKLEAKPPFNAGPALMEALSAGVIDVGYVGPGPVLASHDKSKGEAVRVISGAAANGVLIVAGKDSGITTLAQLKGRKIATPQHGNTQDIAARHYVTKVLGQTDHSNVIAVPNAEQAAMMQRGQIDVAWVPEPWGARLVADAGATIVGEEKDLWPGKQFSLTVVVTTPEFLKAHPDIIEKLLTVHRRWTVRLNTEGEKYLPALGDALYGLTQKKLPTDVFQAAFKRVVFTDDPLPATFTEMGNWTAELGFSRPLSRTDLLFATPSAPTK